MASAPRVRSTRWKADLRLALQELAWAPYFLIWLLLFCFLAALVNLAVADTGAKGFSVPAWMIAGAGALLSLVFSGLHTGPGTLFGQLCWIVGRSLGMLQLLGSILWGSRRRNVEVWLEEGYQRGEPFYTEILVRFGRWGYVVALTLHPEPSAVGGEASKSHHQVNQTWPYSFQPSYQLVKVG